MKINATKVLHKNVNNSLIHKSWKVETALCPTTGDRTNNWYLHKTEGVSAVRTSQYTDGSQKHNAEGKKPGTRVPVIWFHLHEILGQTE